MYESSKKKNFISKEMLAEMKKARIREWNRTHPDDKIVSSFGLCYEAVQQLQKECRTGLNQTKKIRLRKENGEYINLEIRPVRYDTPPEFL